jgi:hypothetical protein
MKGYYYSHAPQGFYYYKYKEPQNGSIGVSNSRGGGAWLSQCVGGAVVVWWPSKDVIWREQ